MSQYSPYQIPKVSMTVASINNVLCTRAFPYTVELGAGNALLRPVFLPLIPTYKHVISINFDSTDSCYLALQGNAWFLLHEALENANEEQSTTLPEAFKQALLESLASPILQKLSTQLDVDIAILESYVDIDVNPSDLSYATLQKNHVRLSFALSVLSVRADITKELFADMWLPKSYDVNNLNNKLLQLPPREKENLFSQLATIPLNLSFEIGFVSIFKSSLLNLECGDVLLPDQLFTKLKEHDEGYLQLILSSNCVNNTKKISALCNIKNNHVEVLEAWKMSEVKMEYEDQASYDDLGEEFVNNDQVHNHEVNQNNTASVQSALGEIEVVVSFELERRSMLLSDIQDITPGYTFALNNDQDAPVTLRVNGKNIGQGRLVDMNGLMGVEVIKLVKA